MLADYVEEGNKTPSICKKTAVMGLGLAYAGSAREDVTELLMPLVEEKGSDMEIFSSAVLSVGLTNCGSSDDELAERLVSAILARTEDDWKDTSLRFAFTV